MTALCIGGRTSPNPPHWRRRQWRALTWLAAALLLPIAAALPAAAAEPIVVFLDQATIIRLPERAQTVVIGNPLIADFSILRGQDHLGVFTGKGYGETNFIVMDRNGVELMKKSVEVKWPNEKLVVVYRGVDRETYSCAPDCSRRIMLGDAPEYFDKTLAQTADRDARVSAIARSGR